jgi:hypothetical protein
LRGDNDPMGKREMPMKTWDWASVGLAVMLSVASSARADEPSSKTTAKPKSIKIPVRVVETTGLKDEGDFRSRPEDRAKSAALTFARALKANDIPAAVGAASVPFLFPDLEAKSPRFGKLEKLAAVAAVAAVLKPLAGDKADFPTAVGEIRTLAALKSAVADELRGADTDAMVKAVGEVGGNDGFLVSLVDDSKEQAAVLLVRIEGKSAKVVGILPVIRTISTK